MKNKLKNRLDKILVEYIKLFEKKHEIYFDSGVGDDLMGILDFGDTRFFSITDVIYDIDHDLPKGLILDWLDYNLENQDKFINLYSYSKGCRHEEE